MIIANAVREFLQTLTAVTDLAKAIRLRRLLETDNWSKYDYILLFVNEENFDTQDINGTSDLVTVNMTVSAVARSPEKAWALAEAIRNGGTEPGTGLQGLKRRTGDVYFDAMLEGRSEHDVPNEDGSDSGLTAVESEFTVKYYETI